MLYDNSILFHFHITYRGVEGDFNHFLRSVIYRVKSQQLSRMERIKNFMSR